MIQSKKNIYSDQKNPMGSFEKMNESENSKNIFWILPVQIISVN